MDATPCLPPTMTFVRVYEADGSETLYPIDKIPWAARSSEFIPLSEADVPGVSHATLQMVMSHAGDNVDPTYTTTAAIRTLVHGANNLFIVKDMSSSKEFVLRVCTDSTIERSGRGWVHRKTHMEACLLRGLHQRGVPVPRLYFVCCDLRLSRDCLGLNCSLDDEVKNNGTEIMPFLLMERVDGVANEWVERNISFDEKINICRDLAKFVVDISKVSVPQDQGIGSVVDLGTDTSSMTVGPLIAQGTLDSVHDRPFATDLEYMRYVYASLKPSSRECEELRDFDRLLELLRPPASDLICHRLVLTHCDLEARNIMTSAGCLKAVIDWEYCGVMPLYLAVNDLIWARYDGKRDAGRFTPLDECGRGSAIWAERRHDAQRYMAEYRGTIASLDPDCAHALLWGRPLRQLKEWLSDWDRGLIELDRYRKAFRKWRDHMESFASLSDLVHSPITSGDQAPAMKPTAC